MKILDKKISSRRVGSWPKNKKKAVSPEELGRKLSLNIFFFMMLTVNFTVCVSLTAVP